MAPGGALTFFLRSVKEDVLGGHFGKKNVDVAQARKTGMGSQRKAPGASLAANASLMS